MSPTQLSKEEWCKQQAIDAFNETWKLMDLESRTQEETLLMIHTAHASRFLWGKVGTPLHFARGEWQLSRVYSVAGSVDRAIVHANASLMLCKENNFGDFDLAFCYEALARAYKLCQDETNYQTN